MREVKNNQLAGDMQNDIRLFLTSTGRNVHEIPRAIDSSQLVDKRPKIATPTNWVPGEKVMILPTVKDEEFTKLFPKGMDKVSMPSGKIYVRTTKNYRISSIIH
ncbi:uncharacterized protein [Bombus fervidus]|uniref:uncharacterized protein n=1 Tax=Bombus fervidus TaxID=203811 RepID=UPI003D18A609